MSALLLLPLSSFFPQNWWDEKLASCAAPQEHLPDDFYLRSTVSREEKKDAAKLQPVLVKVPKLPSFVLTDKDVPSHLLQAETVAEPSTETAAATSAPPGRRASARAAKLQPVGSRLVSPTASAENSDSSPTAEGTSRDFAAPAPAPAAVKGYPSLTKGRPEKRARGDRYKPAAEPARLNKESVK